MASSERSTSTSAGILSAVAAHTCAAASPRSAPRSASAVPPLSAPPPPHHLQPLDQVRNSPTRESARTASSSPPLKNRSLSRCISTQ